MIPRRLLGEPLIRVCRPDCYVHDDCNKPGKRPVTSAYDIEDVDDIVNWLELGGNVGVSLAETDLVVVDGDTDEFAGIAAPHLPTTFTVRTRDGVHQYFRCEEWSRNRSFTVGDREWGSIRSDGWIAVIPPSRHPEGGQYSVMYDKPIESVSRETVAEFHDRVLEVMPNDDDDDQDGNQEGGGRERGPVGGGDLDELDRLIDHDDYRADVREALEDPTASHRQRQFAAGFLLDAVGLSVSETVRVIDKLNHWDNYDRDITEQQVRAVDRSSRGGES